GSARRGFAQQEPLAKAARFHRSSAIVAVRIVSGTAEKRVRGERAAAEANVGEVAIAAEAPQIVLRACTRERELGGAVPDVVERTRAEVTAGVARRLERWTPFHGAVGLDAENVLAR